MPHRDADSLDRMSVIVRAAFRAIHGANRSRIAAAAAKGRASPPTNAEIGFAATASTLTPGRAFGFGKGSAEARNGTDPTASVAAPRRTDCTCAAPAVVTRRPTYQRRGNPGAKGPQPRGPAGPDSE